LKKSEINISGLIDVNRNENSNGLQIIHFEDLPEVPDRLIVSFVATWGAREKIRKFLEEKGWQEGVDFILAA